MLVVVMVEHKCEFCGSTFRKECNLITHKKTAKYCLEIQGRKKDDSSFVCDKCGRSFNYNNNLARHKKSCKSSIIDEKNQLIEDLTTRLKEKDELISQHKKRVETLERENTELKLKLASDEGQIKVYKERPGTTNTNTSTQYVNNKLLQVKCDTIRPFTIETVREEVKAGNYTFDHYIRAERGLVEFILGIISQDEQRSYVCTDSSRHKFHRLLESREWQNDNGATFLNKVFDELTETATGYYERICDMLNNPKEDQELADILMDKTKAMYFGISRPKSKERPVVFSKVRNEVRDLAVI